MATAQSPEERKELELPPAKDFGSAPEDETPIIELGDRIRILGGAYDGTKGRVISRTESEIQLMPDGLTNSAVTFKIDEDGFDPEYGIEGIDILQKRKKPALVDILDLAPGQLLETFKPDGTKGPTYTITKINTDLDSVTVKDESEAGIEIEIPFKFRGIPDNMPFRVVRGRQAPEKLETPESEAEEDADEGEEGEENQSNEEGAETELEDFTFLDDELEAEAEAPADDYEEGVEYLVEIPSSERTYSNITQKSEAYVDILSLFPDKLQKLSQTQKSTRVLTEIFFQLRAAILRVSDDGTPKGIKPTSIKTLIDLLETRTLSISRPVVNMDKTLYYDIDPEEADEPQPDSLDHLQFQYFDQKIQDSAKYLTSSNEIDRQKFYTFMNGYLSAYATTWRGAGAPLIAFQRDEEVYRLKYPDEESSVPGYPSNLPNKKDMYLTADLVSEVKMSLVRGLKAVRAKTGIQQPGEEAAVISYVLLPLLYANSLSYLRLESLVDDMEAGLKRPWTMAEILKAAGEVSDIPSSKAPFVVRTEGGSLGNIPLLEYIKTTGLKAEGLGDFWQLQVLMGLKDREWTIDQKAVLDEIVSKTQSAIYDVILRMRENLATAAAQPAPVQGIQMVPEGPQLIQKLADEPLLKDIQQAIQEQMPSYANSDVALVGLVLRQHSDFAFAQLANQPAALTRSRLKYGREEYLTTIRNIQLTKQRALDAGAPPEPIKCPHVKPLAMIRKVKDNNKRLALLAKFLTKFQGIKADNWVECRVGDHHLLCVHELLQVYQYLRPGDTATLNKDIQLTFGGGQFQGFYICRNCGQPISELEYDTHLEFDDNGKPMMGRAELVDTDAITLEEIDQIIGPLGEIEDTLEFDNETKKLIYGTAKQMADKIYAPLTQAEYMVLVSRVYGTIQQIPTREKYVQIQQAQRRGKKGATTAAAAAAVAEAAAADYDIYINRALVCAVGVHLLITVQCRKPDLVLRISASTAGCRSLRGQPLEPDGGDQGIKCIVSVISSFQKDTAPWSMTQFHREKDDSLRQKAIMDVLEPLLRSALQDPAVQQGLAQKREYKRKTLGAAGKQGRPDEELPTNFAPIPYVMKPEDFAEKIIVPEAATPKDRAELWIRQGNHLAKTSKMPKPIAFTETSCCLSSISEVNEFWKRSAASLPSFKEVIGLPPPPRSTRTEPTMKPSIISRPLPDAPESSYYLLFLKVCYDGEKKGYSHEFGLTHKCMWCGLELPEEVELLTPAQGLNALEQQGIDVSKDSFEDLLNETHKVNSFRTELITEIPGPLDNWTRLTEMEPEPAEGYRAVMSTTQVELSKLPPDAKKAEVLIALSEFSSFAQTMEERLKSRIAPGQHATFDKLADEGAESIVRFLQSYMVVPLKQFISNMAPSAFVPKGWGLSDQHKDDIETLIREHRGYLAKFNKVTMTPWLKAKVETLLVQAREIIDALGVIRPLQVPGGAETFGFFLKFCLYAPLANFADPNTLPLPSASGGAEVPASQVEQQALFPARFVSEMAARFKGEGFRFTPEQIRELIAERNIKESDNIVRKMNDMSRAAKDIEKIKIKLGIGEYAVGGTKAIYAYDQERYDIEREQRAEAGIIDFPGVGPYDEGVEAGANRQMDGLGYYRDEGEEDGYIGDDMLGEINGFDDDN